MSEYKSAIIAFVVLAVLGAFWWHEYVAPKETVLLEAHECLTKQGYKERDLADPAVKAEWGRCLNLAEAKSGTTTLRVVGY